MKKLLLGTLAVFGAWFALDWIIHAQILKSTYEATAPLWRPEGEMKFGVMTIVGLIAAFAFVSIYARLIGNKSTATGLKYGLWFGLATGVSMGYGSYAVMPIPYHLALVWFLGSLVEAGVGGCVAGLVIKD